MTGFDCSNANTRKPQQVKSTVATNCCFILSLTGSAMVPLNRLPKGNVLDEWYPLLPSSHAKMEVGSIRVRSKFTVRKQLTDIRNVSHNNTFSKVLCKELIRLSNLGLKKCNVWAYYSGTYNKSD